MNKLIAYVFMVIEKTEVKYVDFAKKKRHISTVIGLWPGGPWISSLCLIMPMALANLQPIEYKHATMSDQRHANTGLTSQVCSLLADVVVYWYISKYSNKNPQNVRSMWIEHWFCIHELRIEELW